MDREAGEPLPAVDSKSELEKVLKLEKELRDGMADSAITNDPEYGWMADGSKPPIDKFVGYLKQRKANSELRIKVARSQYNLDAIAAAEKDEMTVGLALNNASGGTEGKDALGRVLDGLRQDFWRERDAYISANRDRVGQEVSRDEFKSEFERLGMRSVVILDLADHYKVKI